MKEYMNVINNAEAFYKACASEGKNVFVFSDVYKRQDKVRFMASDAEYEVLECGVRLSLIHIPKIITLRLNQIGTAMR